MGGGECYNTTCSTSWLVVSPLIPLGESGDVALKRTPPQWTARGSRVTICVASLGDYRSQPRSEVVRPAACPGPPSGFRPRSEAVPNVHVAPTPETRSYALLVICSKLDRASRPPPTYSHDETHGTKSAHMHRPSTPASGRIRRLPHAPARTLSNCGCSVARYMHRSEHPRTAVDALTTSPVPRDKQRGITGLHAKDITITKAEPASPRIPSVARARITAQVHWHFSDYCAFDSRGPTACEQLTSRRTLPS